MEGDPEELQRPPVTDESSHPVGEDVSQVEDLSSPAHPDEYPHYDSPDETEEEGGPVKSFLEHLEDLRWVFIKVGSAIIIAMIICLFAAPTLISVLKYPVENSGLSFIKLEWLGPLGGFMTSLKLGFYGG